MAMTITTIKVEMESWVKKMLCEKKKEPTIETLRLLVTEFQLIFPLLYLPVAYVEITCLFQHRFFRFGLQN